MSENDDLDDIWGCNVTPLPSPATGLVTDFIHQGRIVYVDKFGFDTSCFLYPKVKHLQVAGYDTACSVVQI